jgi:hypothetical protein
MKPRHAAALALVGWYLVLPPKEGLIVKPAAPMRDWKIEQSFKTIRECEDFRHNVSTATLALEKIRIARALAGEIEIDPNTGTSPTFWATRRYWNAWPATIRASRKNSSQSR